jgi:superfamily II DNA or RNA helicase
MAQDGQTGAAAIRAAGEEIFRRGSVSLHAQDARALTLFVGGATEHTVVLHADGASECTCGEHGDAGCAHIAAALLKAAEDGSLRLLRQERELLLGQEMLLALSRAMPGGESVRIAATIRLFADGRVGFGVQLGQERLYAVRSIAELLRCYARGTPLTLSERFTWRPSDMRFSKDEEALLAMLLSHLPPPADGAPPDDEDAPEPEGTAPRPTSEGRFVLLGGAFLQSVLRFYETRPFLLMAEGVHRPQANIRTVELPLCFSVSVTGGAVLVRVDGAEDMRPITPDGRYVLEGGRIVRLHGAQARVCRLLGAYGRDFRYPAQDTQETLSTLLPALSTVGTVVPSAGLSRRLVSAPLKARAYLDIIDGNVEARIALHYGEQELNPFTAAPDAPDAAPETAAPAPDVPEAARQQLLLRDGRAESELLDFFGDAGFVVRQGRIVLRRARDILAFCTQGVAELSKLAEVYVSDAFTRIKPRRFSGRASFRMRGGRLVFTLLEDSQPVAEVLPILQAVVARQQYVRLKTGEFLDLRDMAGLAPVAQELLDAAALDDPAAAPDARELSFGAYRAAYLVSMLRLAGGEVNATEDVEHAARALSERAEEQESFIPTRLARKLAPYQKRGVGWILSLYEARMGGILADEMGLGKTVQVIAAISAAKKKNGGMKSLIVTPTSLVYHWLAEFKRFDESLTVRLVSGVREERRKQIDELRADPAVDVILTSYPLLRRDIDQIRDIPLRFAILDEAQFVKNAQSIGAAAAKELDAQVRVAMTGTPMENHTGELWSIFDFALPGYLGTQASFLRRYGGSERAEELQERIRPFLMRRLKQEVLSDLPEKREQSLYAAMTPEQEHVYTQLLTTLRQHVGEALASGSLPRARMQVLSVLLKLRQVCCHPKLFLPDYEGTSGKLELLVQTVQQAVQGKRRMLVFSQFVGMLQIIRKRLSREGVRTLYLDGNTKPEARQELCDRFNGGEGQVFLISLKAGGTGLNLTGADLVIHYDPWWNPAVEDQATDRAHRIGQTKDVDVLRLIAQGTIEEKVTDLSKRKRAIFDRVVLAGETALDSLTEEDIRRLFF